MKTEEFDLTWSNPTPAQTAGFHFALICQVAAIGITEFQAAEMLCMLPSSLTGQQIQNWADGKVEGMGMGEETQQIFIQQSKNVKAILELGYDPEANRWWNLKKLGWTRDQTALNMALLHDWGLILEQVQKHTLYVVAAGHQLILHLILGKNWRTKAAKLAKDPQAFLAKLLMPGGKRGAQPGASAGEPDLQPCINPHCTNGADGGRAMVDTGKKKSGACSKACMNFECVHPDCVKRAAANGWGRATHPWGTKIATQHAAFRRAA